jgi:hypothetical protein
MTANGHQIKHHADPQNAPWFCEARHAVVNYSKIDYAKIDYRKATFETKYRLPSGFMSVGCNDLQVERARVVKNSDFAFSHEDGHGPDTLHFLLPNGLDLVQSGGDSRSSDHPAVTAGVSKPPCGVTSKGRHIVLLVRGAIKNWYAQFPLAISCFHLSFHFHLSLWAKADGYSFLI